MSISLLTFLKIITHNGIRENRSRIRYDATRAEALPDRSNLSFILAPVVRVQIIATFLPPIILGPVQRSGAAAPGRCPVCGSGRRDGLTLRFYLRQKYVFRGCLRVIDASRLGTSFRLSTSFNTFRSPKFNRERIIFSILWILCSIYERGGEAFLPVVRLRVTGVFFLSLRSDLV